MRRERRTDRDAGIVRARLGVTEFKMSKNRGD